MQPPRRVLEYLHVAAWRLGFDVMPVAKESRRLSGMTAEDVYRLHGVLQRALGQGRAEDIHASPEWAGLVAEALQLLDQGIIPRAQFLQDVWVLRSTASQRCGYFVEIGAGDGLYVSNTYLLEREFGWTGVLCEPNPRFAEAIRSRQRSGSTLLEYAVGPRSGETVQLVDLGERSTVSGPASVSRRLRRGHHQLTQVTTITPTEVLERAGAPDEIDYLSVDTEGSEPQILESFPWRRYSVRYITVEHNNVRGRVPALDGLLGPLGYRRVLTAWSGVDAWYVHADALGEHGAP